MEFFADSRLFEVDYHHRFLTPEAIFAAVWQAGKKMGKEYLPRLVAKEAPGG